MIWERIVLKWGLAWERIETKSHVITDIQQHMVPLTRSCILVAL